MKPSETAHLRTFAATHPGMTGKLNEDRFSVDTFQLDKPTSQPAVLAVICDGIGGHRAGEVAAQIGVDVIRQTVAASDASQPVAILADAISRANQAVYAASLADSGRAGMGATCACAWIIGNRLYTVNLGDSRIYLCRDNHLLQLTTDHTWLQEAMDAGLIDEGQGSDHPNAHVIRRYLGSQNGPNPDFRLWLFEGEDDAGAQNNQGAVLQPGDILLLCTDGVTDLVSDAEIKTLLREEPLSAVAQQLIDLANSRGGHDNSTVVLMQMPLSPKPAVTGQRRLLSGCLIALVVISLVVTGVLLGLRWRQDPPAPTATISLHQQSNLTWTPIVTQTFTAQPAQATPTQSVTFPVTDVTGSRSTITPWPTNPLLP